MTPADLLRDIAVGKRHDAANLQAQVTTWQDRIEEQRARIADLLRQGAELEQAADQLDSNTS